MIRPQTKRQKQKEEMRATLKKGDKVVTMGGINGTVQGFKEKGKGKEDKEENKTKQKEKIIRAREGETKQRERSKNKRTTHSKS